MLIVITSVYYLFNEHVNTGVPSLGIMSRGCLVVWNHGFLWLSIPIGSMVLLYMVTWIPSIYPIYVCIYTSTSRIRHGIYWECHHPNWRSPSFFRGVGQPPTSIIFMIFLWYSYDIPMIFLLYSWYSYDIPKEPFEWKKVRNTGCWGPMFRQTMATSRYFSWPSNHNGTSHCMTLNTVLTGTYWNNILEQHIGFPDFFAATKGIQCGPVHHPRVQRRRRRSFILQGPTRSCGRRIRNSRRSSKDRKRKGIFLWAKKRAEREYILCSDMFR